MFGTVCGGIIQAVPALDSGIADCGVAYQCNARFPNLMKSLPDFATYPAMKLIDALTQIVLRPELLR